MARLVAVLFAVLAASCSQHGRAITPNGVASHYHEDTHVATGERFDPEGMTAAHRTLKFGTKVRVTNPANGKSVVVVINDRGPAAWTRRDIDLARGAARVIGMIEAGVIPVQIDILPGED